MGAALDAGALRVFEPLERAAERARARIQRALGQTGVRAGGSPYRRMATDVERFTRTEEMAGLRRLENAKRFANRRVEVERAANRAIEEDLARSARAIQRAANAARRAAGGGGGRGGGGGGGHGAGGGFFGGGGFRVHGAVHFGGLGFYGFGPGGVVGALAGRAAFGAAHALTAGLGVETDPAELLRRGVEYQAESLKIINESPAMRGSSLERRHAASADLERRARGVATETATDMGDLIGGVRKFVDLTGDLDTARDVMSDMGRIAKATGSNVFDIANAMGEISMHLGDVPDKGKVVVATMRAIAGQGELGAVVIRDMAKYMARLGATAPVFEGDQSKNIAVLGAVAQMAKIGGTATTAAEAAMSAARLATGLTTPKTVEKWKALGLTPFTDASQTTLRGPQSLILDALRVTQGNLEMLQTLFPEQRSMRAVRGFATVFQRAGGGEAGIKAVEDAFAKFANAALSEEEITRQLNAALQTTQSRAQIFNTRLQELAENVETALLPALEALGPAVLGAIDFFNTVLGTKPKAAVEGAEVVEGKVGESVRLLRSTATVEKPPKGSTGKPVTVYREDVIDQMVKQGAERSSALGKVETEIKDSEYLARQAELRVHHGPAQAAHWLFNKMAGAFGLHPDTPEDKARAARAQADELKTHREKLLKENEEQNKVLRDIHIAIKSGNARKEMPKPTGADRTATTPGNAARPQ